MGSFSGKCRFPCREGSARRPRLGSRSRVVVAPGRTGRCCPKWGTGTSVGAALLCMRLVTGTTASSLFRPRMPSVRGSKLLAQGRTARWWGGWHSRSGGSAARARAPDDGVPAPHPSKAGPLPSAAAPPPSTGPKTLQLQSCCAPYCHQSCPLDRQSPTGPSKLGLLGLVHSSSGSGLRACPLLRSHQMLLEAGESCRQPAR